MKAQANRARPGSALFCHQELWHGRSAFRLGNGLAELVTLTGGGHIAEFRFTGSGGRPTVNPLWTPPWKTTDPFRYRSQVDAARYGPLLEGKLLSGIAGHNICLDYFGPPSPEEAEQGLSQHGEAPSLRWSKISQSVSGGHVTITLSVRLPAAGLRFHRKITLRKDQPVVTFRETVQNEKKCDHFFHWVQHVTLGPPFLSSRETKVSVPGTRGITFPLDYGGGKSLLALGRKFRWPLAPARSGEPTNLENVLIRKGAGFVASTLIDPRRDWGYVAALNTQHRLLIGYCFRREDFPWVAVWEENRAIRAVPWQKRTETRGLEFGTTPVPSTRRDTFRQGNLYDTETFVCVPACGRKTIEYFAFLAQTPPEVKGIGDVRCTDEEVVVYSNVGKLVARVPNAWKGSGN
ncbi:MAG TPA: hypothetical protein VGY31_07255 [Terriglobia bacterium]|nr:hypothetical protein [Terriglobia bacterium]